MIPLNHTPSRRKDKRKLKVASVVLHRLKMIELWKMEEMYRHLQLPKAIPTLQTVVFLEQLADSNLATPSN
jgi:hypothetical protein